MRRDPEPEAQPGELNLVPFLDVLVNLLIFMLVTYQVAAELQTIRVEPPGRGPSVEGPVALTVGITASGYQIWSPDPGGVERIPRRGDATDTQALTARLAALRESFALGPTLVLTADPDVAYEDVVRTLDAARVAPDGSELFPRVTFAMPI